MFFTWMYPQRSISKLTLLKGGENVQLQTYSHFGRKRDFIAPVKNISFLQSRQSSNSQMTFKVKGNWWFYIMDKKSGKFMDTDLFDFAVGLKRVLK